MITDKNYATPNEVSENLSISLDKPIVLFTQHSVTTEFDKAEMQVIPSLEALARLAEEDAQIILTYPNNDAGSDQIIRALNKYHHKNNVQLHKSLGRYLYHGVLALALNKEIKIVCVGNSSSGLKETPAFKCPTVNIGSRQDGRLRGFNVLTTDYNESEIRKAILTCLFDKSFREICRTSHNPYGIGDAGSKIADVLREVTLDESLLRKKMMLKGEVKDGWYR